VAEHGDARVLIDLREDANLIPCIYFCTIILCDFEEIIDEMILYFENSILNHATMSEC
jgi:hypothetical protein